MNDYYEYLLFIRNLWPLWAKHCFCMVYLCSKDDVLHADAVWIREDVVLLLKN